MPTGLAPTSVGSHQPGRVVVVGAINVDLVRAVAASTLAVTADGARAGMPTAAAVDALTEL